MSDLSLILALNKLKSFETLTEYDRVKIIEVLSKSFTELTEKVAALENSNKLIDNIVRECMEVVESQRVKMAQVERHYKKSLLNYKGDVRGNCIPS